MSKTMGQPKLHSLAAHDDVALTVLVPDRMCIYGEWQTAEVPDAPPFKFVVGRTRWQNLMNQWYLLHYADALGPLLRDCKPDVIDIWEEPWSLACAQTIWLARRLCPKAKIIVETEQNIFKKLPPPFRQFQAYSLRRADAMVARNTEAVEVLRRKGYAGPVSVVPNAVECSLFHPLPSHERAARRRDLGWGTPQDFVFGYVGRIVPEKGLADALTALAALPENARLAVVGEGPLRADLEAEAKRLGIMDRVVFAGSRPLTELPGVMNALDALILPSRTTPSWKEQFGRVLIEAGACGIPVIGSDSGAIPEVIEDAGLVFPEGDAPALAGCLRLLAGDAGLRRRMGEIGRERALHQFSWQRVASRMRALYHAVLHDVPDESPADARRTVAA